jgi:H+/Cl- antiporter ClcA
MIKNLLSTFLKKALYGLAAGIAAIILQLAQGPPPEGEMNKLLWTLLFVPLLTGLAALIKRWASWNPEKALGGR